MSTDTLFMAANAVALWGWIALLASPRFPDWSDRIAGVIIPLLLAAAYTALAALYLSGALTGGTGAGYFTLDAVMKLFATKEVVLAGWLHVLAFDLFVGAWIVRTARTESISFGWVVLCLVPTFLFGPAGLLAFYLVRTLNARH